MKANHIPVVERLRNRIHKLELLKDINHIKSPHKGNPYWCCAKCDIHDPSLSIRKGKHFDRCPIQGLDKEILYYKRLLDEHVKPKPATSISQVPCDAPDKRAAELICDTTHIVSDSGGRRE